MAITPQTIHALIAAAFPDAEISVQDTTGGGDHYSVTVVSSTFEGKLPLDRHRAIYAALGEAMRADIHALGLKTLTPAESQNRQQHQQKDNRP